MSSLNLRSDPKSPASQAANLLDQLCIEISSSSCLQILDAETAECSIEDYTDRETLLKLHAGTEWSVDQVLSNGSAAPITKFYFKSLMMDPNEVKRLKPKKRVNIATLVKSVDRPLKGKYFVCRTITSPIIHESLFQVVVDEPEGSKAVPLLCYLHDDPRGKTPEEFIPTGTFFIIKNPMMTKTTGAGYGIRCLDPKDLFVCTSRKPSKLGKLFPGQELKWDTEIKKDATKEAMADLVKDVKGLGNLAYADKRYPDAIDHYSQGLLLDPKNLNLLSNRAACFLGLRCYGRALEDTLRVLDIEPFHLKGMYRKVKALWGLCEYEGALEFIHKKLSKDLTPEKSQCLTTLMEIGNTILGQSKTGKNYDLVQYLEDGMKSHDVGEFTRGIEISDKCLVATEDIEPGRLLHCSKAFAIYYTGSDLDMKKSKDNDAMARSLADLVYYKLQIETKHKEEFYNMPKLWKPPTNTTTKANAAPISPECQEMDDTFSIIVRNCEKLLSNGLALPGTVQSELEVLSHLVNYGASVGLWTLPSFVRDGCFDANSSKFVVGDLLFIRAIKKIRKGDKILVARQTPLIAYLDKRVSCQRRGYICKCTLCLLDAQDSESSHHERKNLGMSMHMRFLRSSKNPDYEPSNDEVELLVQWISKLRNLRVKKPELNIYIMIPVHYLAEIFYVNREFIHCVTLWKEAYGLALSAGLGRHLVGFASSIIDCLILLEKSDEAKKWTKILQKDLMIHYGSLDVMQFYESGVLENIYRAGICFL